MKIKKTLIAISTAIIISIVGMTTVNGEEISTTSNSSIAFGTNSSTSDKSIQIPINTYTNNQCTCYDMVIEYDHRLDFNNVNGAQAYYAFKENEKKYVAIVGYSAEPYKDGEPIATVNLDIPEEEVGNDFLIKIDSISSFSNGKEEIELSSPIENITQIINVKKDNNGIKGDVNKNNKVEIKDALLIAKSVSKRDFTQFDEKDISCGDINKDGKLSIKDAAEIARYIARGRVW